jgi:hypothetical protein
LGLTHSEKIRRKLEKNSEKFRTPQILDKFRQNLDNFSLSLGMLTSANEVFIIYHYLSSNHYKSFFPYLSSFGIVCLIICHYLFTYLFDDSFDCPQIIIIPRLTDEDKVMAVGFPSIASQQTARTQLVALLGVCMYHT